MRDYIMTFFGKNNSLFGEVSPYICKNSFLNFPNIFPVKLHFLKVHKKFLGRRMQVSIQNPFEILRWSFLHK